MGTSRRSHRAILVVCLAMLLWSQPAAARPLSAGPFYREQVLAKEGFNRGVKNAPKAILEAAGLLAGAGWAVFSVPWRVLCMPDCASMKLYIRLNRP